MGVFARLLRRSKATAETPAAEAQPETAKAGTEADTTEAQTAQAAPTAGAKGDDEAPEAAEPAAESTASVAESEGVDIPQQQSTEKAADNEAGEGARK
ncbi:hypothetical protein ADK65_17220 [Streptomyces sp. NRRL B-1140]|uniref:hypothetical protein n=1 Tax=Streptomyces sp. NRRL B-1140 TaxID=1415549 RepID=UPI0006AF7C11|nr:hypothetical protein [Streptomyces sp. NRRL B-1140]KOV99862.1 hypothetical protein ADK65_17220 [Streptomyces sp. NRRL B-1140]